MQAGRNSHVSVCCIRALLPLANACVVFKFRIARCASTLLTAWQCGGTNGDVPTSAIPGITKASFTRDPDRHAIHCTVVIGNLGVACSKSESKSSRFPVSSMPPGILNGEGAGKSARDSGMLTYRKMDPF